MIDYEYLTTWDLYQMILNAKPLSSNRLKKTLEFDKQFDDMRFNDAVDVEYLNDLTFNFLNYEISISKAVFVGTGYYGDDMEFLGGDNHYKKDKSIPGTIHYIADVDDDIVNESIMEYKTFEDAFNEALNYIHDCYRFWESKVVEFIYQNNRNPNKYLSVVRFGDEIYSEYFVLQYIENYNPRLNETVRTNVGTVLNDDTHIQWNKSDLDNLLEDYTLLSDGISIL